MVMAGSPDTDLREEASLEGVTAGNVSRSLNCTQCNAKFSRIAHLRRHQRTRKSHAANGEDPLAESRLR